MNPTITRLLIAAIALTAMASVPTRSDPACVAVDFTLASYSGPIHIGNACLESATHDGDTLVIRARDDSGLIFHGDFEQWP